MYKVNPNGGSPNQLATMYKKLDMTVKAMTFQNISPSQQAAPLQVCVVCSQFDHTTETCPLYSFAGSRASKLCGTEQLSSQEQSILQHL